MQLRSTGFDSLFSPNLGNVYNCKKINKHNQPDRVFSLKHDCIHVILSPQSFSWEFGIASIRFPRNQCFYFRLVFSISILHHFATISCVCFKFCWYPRIFGISFFQLNCHQLLFLIAIDVTTAKPHDVMFQMSLYVLQRRRSATAMFQV